MFQSEHLQEKWKPLLEAEGCEAITDPHRKAVTAVLLENQEKFLRETSSFETHGMLNEAVPTKPSKITLTMIKKFSLDNLKKNVEKKLCLDNLFNL